LALQGDFLEKVRLPNRDFRVQGDDSLERKFPVSRWPTLQNDALHLKYSYRRSRMLRDLLCHQEF
jgi:hypothetical protein